MTLNSAIAMQVLTGISTFFQILRYILWGYCIFSWIARPDWPVYRFLARFCEPLLYPFRRLLNDVLRTRLMVDISPILAVVALSLLERLLYRIVYMFF